MYWSAPGKSGKWMSRFWSDDFPTLAAARLAVVAVCTLSRNVAAPSGRHARRDGAVAMAAMSAIGSARATHQENSKLILDT